MRISTFIFLLLFLSVKPFSGYSQILESIDDTSGIKKPQPIKLININDAIEKTNKKILEYDKLLSEKVFFVSIDSVLKKKEEIIKNEAKLFNKYNPNKLSQYFLENEYRAWIGYQKNINDASKLIRSKLNIIDETLAEIEWDYKVWLLTRKEIERNSAVPYGIKGKIKDVIYELKKLKESYTNKKKELLIWESKVSDLQLLSNDILSNIVSLQLNLRDSLLVSNKPPLWKTKVPREDVFPVMEKVTRSVKDNLRIIKNFISQFKFGGIIFFSILISVLFFIIRKKYFKVVSDKNEPGYKNVQLVFDKHWVSAFIIIVLSVWLTVLSKMPLSLTSLLATLMLIALYFIIPDFVGRQGKKKILMIFLLFLINEFEIMMWYFGNLSRFYLLLEGVIGILITYYFGTEKLKRPDKNSSLFEKRLFYISLILLLAYSLGFIANLFGFVNLTVMFYKLAAQSASIIILIYGIQKILKIFVTAICTLGKYDKYSSLQGYWDSIEEKTNKIINIIAFFFGLKLILGTLDVYRSSYEYVVNILTSKLRVGTISLSLGGIIGMVLIIILSYYLSKIFEVLFVNNRVVKKKISKGLAFAISSSIKYVLIFFGVILGMAYAGIDIGKFSLFTGALGVGIGFGLQNIVNNFISGLILLYERPVEVGDTIEVGELIGVVKKIGVRASKVRTYDGAEVVVPNGNIVSNDLINWTLSDDKRRLEIKVGVAYGTDVNKVLKILQKIAVNNEYVFPDPPPRVYFEKFGDSSLNFRLLCWVPYENGLSARSELSIAIYNAFAEEGVEIPFPQVDLHVKDINNGTLTQKPEVVMPPAPDNSPYVSGKENDNEDKKNKNKD